MRAERRGQATQADALISKAFGLVASAQQGSIPPIGCCWASALAGILRGEALLAQPRRARHSAHAISRARSGRCAAPSKSIRHAAMAGLFRLARALRYKRKRGLPRAGASRRPGASLWAAFAPTGSGSVPPLDLPEALLAKCSAAKLKSDQARCTAGRLHRGCITEARAQPFGRYMARAESEPASSRRA